MPSAPVIDVPENRIDSPSALCSLGLSPHRLSGIVLQLLRSHFSDAQHIQDASIRKKLTDWGPWKSTPDSRITIETSSRWRPEKADSRPALIVHRRQLRPDRRLIGEFAGANAMTGQQDFIGFWSGVVTIGCFSADAGEAELLSWEAGQYLRRFCSLFVEKFELHRCQILQIGEYQKLKFEPNERAGVPVDLGYVFEDDWSVTPDAPLLKRVSWVPEQG